MRTKCILCKKKMIKGRIKKGKRRIKKPYCNKHSYSEVGKFTFVPKSLQKDREMV